ncbi:MAG: terminase family protein [Alphaproteobacteria bacterium]|nr:terminase family protein [Alphaproteobacteria bacterium]
MTDKLQALAADLEELARRKRENRLAYYAPYQKQREFHALGLKHRERLFLAGNQLGKTWAGGMEMAAHLTGDYPEWWEGKRFAGPVRAWAAGVTGESTRDNPQRILLGVPGQWGTGAIPRDRLDQTRTGRGLPDAVDTAFVKHRSGGLSQLSFKAYEKGREKWQGETLDAVWLDEEPPPDIYAEALARITARAGLVYLTCTPLLGMSEVIRKYLQGESIDRAHVRMELDDALHIAPAERQRIIDGYPEHEREARVRGIPMLGSGRVFPVAESAISEAAFAMPRHFARIVGMDFGWDHPTAAAWLAWDRDTDIIHIYDCYRVREATPVIHAAAIKARGAWIPVAWPHDGLQHDKQSGEPLAEAYRKLGVRMLPARAEFAGGGHGVEAGIMEMLDRMQTGRLKVAGHLAEWFDEFRLYHRKDGRIVKEHDDLMSATRYALMMLRKARTEAEAVMRRGVVQYAETESRSFLEV